MRKNYAKRRQLSIEGQLGAGVDGVVLLTNKKTAMKALRFESQYKRELAVYLRLQEHRVEAVAGLTVPTLVGHHDELLIVEMDVVTPPFIVDFASAYVDSRPPYPITDEWLEEKREQFEDKWPDVQRVVVAFERYGIYLADVKPGNIVF